MSRISRKYQHFVFGVIQSGITCAVAAAIASLPFYGIRWLLSGQLACYKIPYPTNTIHDGMRLASQSLDSGATALALEKLIAVSNEVD